MSRTVLTCIAYLLLLAGMMAGYNGAKRLYAPQVPMTLDAGKRESDVGVFLYRCQKVDQAMELCRQSVVTSPNLAVAHFQLGTLYGRENMPNEAMVEYREAIRCRPGWAAAHVNLGIVLGQSGRLEDAAEEFRRAGNDPDARYNLELTERELLRRRTRQPYPGG